MDEILSPGQWTELQARLQKKYPEISVSALPYHEAAEIDVIQMVEYQFRKYKAAFRQIAFRATAPFPFRSRKLLSMRTIQ